MTPYYYFFSAILLFYLADVLQKISSTGHSTWSYIFYRSIFTTSISLIASLILAGYRQFPAPLLALKTVGISFICSLGFYFYIKAVNATRFSNVGALSIIGNVFQMMIGFLLFKEAFHWTLLPVILLMSAGSILQLLNLKSSKGAIDVMLSVFFWTVGYTALSRILQEVNVFWTVPLMEFSILLMSGFMSKLKNENQGPGFFYGRISLQSMFLIGIFIFCGSYFNHLSYQKFPVSVISLLQLSVMPITYLLSLKIFREKPSRIELISFVTGFTGFGLYIWIKFGS